MQRIQFAMQFASHARDQVHHVAVAIDLEHVAHLRVPLRQTRARSLRARSTSIMCSAISLASRRNSASRRLSSSASMAPGHRVRAGGCRRWDRVPPRDSPRRTSMPTPAKRRTGRSPPHRGRSGTGWGCAGTTGDRPPGSAHGMLKLRDGTIWNTSPASRGPAGALPGGQSSHRPGRPGSCRPVRLPPATR